MSSRLEPLHTSFQQRATEMTRKTITGSPVLFPCCCFCCCRYCGLCVARELVYIAVNVSWLQEFPTFFLSSSAPHFVIFHRAAWHSISIDKKRRAHIWFLHSHLTLDRQHMFYAVIGFVLFIFQLLRQRDHTNINSLRKWFSSSSRRRRGGSWTTWQRAQNFLDGKNWPKREKRHKQRNGLSQLTVVHYFLKSRRPHTNRSDDSNDVKRKIFSEGLAHCSLLLQANRWYTRLWGDCAQ